MFVAASDHDIPPGWIALPAIVGTASLVGFSVDALNSDSDARSPVGQASRSVPSFALRAPQLALLPSGSGGMRGAISIGGTF
jgi:hypothetical protein